MTLKRGTRNERGVSSRSSSYTSAELVGATEEKADLAVSMAKPAGERSAQADPVTHRVLDANSVASLAVSIMQVLAVGALARQCGMHSLLKHSLDQVQRLAMLEDVRLLR